MVIDTEKQEIIIKTYNDSWTNKDEVNCIATKYFIENNETKFLFVVPEGVSLYEIGLINFIQQFQQLYNIKTANLEVCCHNIVENIPYNNIQTGIAPLAFFQAKDYQKIIPVSTNAKRLGLFIGRPSIERLSIIKYFYETQLINDISLISLLKVDTDNVYIDSNNNKTLDWLVNSQDLHRWYIDHQPIIGSVDKQNRNIDQSTLNVNLSNYYHLFNIELVCETMVYGNTFYPTEKTIRPIALGKPFIIFSAPNWLSNLKKLGFKTFSELWDEKYDQADGISRWILIKQLIEHIQQMNTVEFGKMMLQASDIVSYNYNILQDIQKKFQTTQYPKIKFYSKQ